MNKLLPALAVSALAAATFGTSAAQAADCSGGNPRLQLRGASFQTAAHRDAANGWIFNGACQVGTLDSVTSGDGNTGFNAGDDLVYYDGEGSGNGLAAFGSGAGTGVYLTPAGTRDNLVAGYGTDDPAPQGTGTIGRNMEEGLNNVAGTENQVNDNDDGINHTIPVAQGAVAVIVKQPLGCKVPGTQAYAKRWKLPVGVPGDTNSALEKVFSGEITTWGQLGWKENVTNAPCPKVIRRYVRKDGSGTTFGFKNFLESTDEGNTTDWDKVDEVQDVNTKWPKGSDQSNPDTNPATIVDASGGTCNGTAGEYVCVGSGNGNGSLASALNALGGGEGGIGFADVGTARSAQFGWLNTSDRTYFLPLYSPTSTTTLYDPTYNSQGFKQNATVAQKGANCVNAEYGIGGTGALPVNTKADWSTTYQDVTVAGYPICLLTYVGAWEDYEDAYTDAQISEVDKGARQAAVEDYLTYLLGTDPLGIGVDEGQTLLPNSDYAALPTAVRNTALTYFNAAQFDKAPDLE